MIAALCVDFVFVTLLASAAWFLGGWIARALEAPESVVSLRPLLWIERLSSSAIGSSYKNEMTWREYLFAFVAFHVCGIALLFIILRWQGLWTLDPLAQNMDAYMAFNTAVSFATNTNWQAYIPEKQMAWPVQMVGLTVQHFMSAAAGVAVLCVVARAFRRSETNKLGNFWQDLVRCSVYVLLPLSFAVALALSWTGVPQTAAGEITIESLEGPAYTIPVGMCASQVAIKQLGTNGGGFYNANSAHPLENPSPIPNLIELAAIILLPMALCRTFGELVRSKRQGLLFLAVMGIFLFCAIAIGMYSEGRAVPGLYERAPSLFQAEGNMEGKECRFGPFWSVLWAVATTATGNGSVNASLSSLFPLTGGLCLTLIDLGEVVFGGLGTGMTSAVVFLLIAVFAAGLMVGRTPEYLGKKIEAKEMKFVALLAIFPSAVVLMTTAYALTHPEGLQALSVHGPHGFSEALYAMSSTVMNNGSSFAGLAAGNPVYLIATACTMYVGRIFPVAMLLALSGALVEKRRVALTAGTLDTDSLAFGVWFGFVFLMLGALNFIPALTLGPVIEHMNLFVSR
jgi:potassium-transporting ATPase potassium-binding subunit